MKKVRKTNVVNWKALNKIVPGCGGKIYNILNRHNSNLIKLELAIAVFKPEEKGERHYHKWTEEIYHILKGKAVVELRSERIKVGEEDSIAIPVNTSHKIENIGKKKLIFLSINSCPYDEKDIFKV